MLKMKFSTIFLILTLFLIYPADAKIINVNVSEDAYISQADPNINYGKDPHMYNFYTSCGREQKAFLKFNVPAHTTNAILYVYTDDGWKNNQNAYVAQSSSEWKEDTVTWNNPPYSISNDRIASKIMDYNNQWKAFNVSSVITDSSSTKNYSFRLMAEWGYNDSWVSKEGGYVPYLVVTTSDSANIATNADFKSNETSGNLPLTVQFTDTSSGSPISWNWNFGDRSINSIEQNPIHTYTTAGIYTVSLTATNSTGNDTETKTGYITVADTFESVTTNVTASDDTWIYSATPDINHGLDSHLSSAVGSEYKYFFMKFRVPPQTVNATLHIYSDGAVANGHNVIIRQTGTNWYENTLTYNNRPSSIIDYVNVSALNQPDPGWHEYDVSSVIRQSSNPYNISFQEITSYGYSEAWQSKEGDHAPYLECHSGAPIYDIGVNNKTNNDSKAFLVSTNEVIRFTLNDSNVANATWFVNKTQQSGKNSYFDFKVPSFNVNYPSTGIWEIRAEGNYTNGTALVREWLISGLTEEQAPDFIDSFIDMDNTIRNGQDPWSRDWPIYSAPGTNYVSSGVLKGNSETSQLVTPLSINRGTYVFKARADGWANSIRFYVEDEDGDFWNLRWDADATHDYFAVNSMKANRGFVKGRYYIPVSRSVLGQAPGHHYFPQSEWHNLKIIFTDDDWLYLYDNDALVTRSCLHVPYAIGNVTTLKIYAMSDQKMDNIEIYNEKFLYPPTEIKYGIYPKWWEATSEPYFTPIQDYGIIVYGRELTLKQISDILNNESLITYNVGTKTATVKTNLFIKAGAELNIANETVIFDTTSSSKFIAPLTQATLRIQNSTITTNGDSILFWSLSGSQAFSIYNPERNVNQSTRCITYTAYPAWDSQVKLIIENSTINNTSNLFLDACQEIKINDTVFANMSDLDYGTYAQSPGQPFLNMKIAQATGNKSIWIVPRGDLAAYSFKNVSFITPKKPINLKVVGGEFIFNDTVLRDSDFSNIAISTRSTKKYTEMFNFNIWTENNSLALLNCKYNDSNLTVENKLSQLKTKYYADVVIHNTNGNPVPNTTITFAPSNASYPAENLYEYDFAISDAYGPGKGGESSGYYSTVIEGGAYYRWYNARVLGTAISDSNGMTSLPNGNASNSIVLTDYVLINKSGIQSKESIRYDLTISPPNSKILHIQDLDPDSTWYRKNPLVSEYTITAVIPDNSSKGPHIIGFAPSKDNSFDSGEKKNFRVWTDGNLTGMAWTIDGVKVAQGTLNFTWDVTEGNHTIEFSGIGTNGTTVSQVWKLGGGSSNQTSIVKFLPESNSLIKNLSESVTFSANSSQLLTKKWYINGTLTQNNTTTMTKSWNTSGTYNVTFSGSTGEKSVTNTWIVNVTKPTKSQNKSIVPITLDNRLRETSPTLVFEKDLYLDVGELSSVGKYRDILAFNLSGYSSSTQVSNATLSLCWYYPNSLRKNDTVIEIYRPAYFWNPSYVSWKKKDKGIAWKNTGGDWYDKNGVFQGSTPYASLIIKASSLPNSTYCELNVTDLVKEYVRGKYANTGFLIKARSESNNYIAFYSSDCGNESRIPKLSITSE